MAQGHTLSQTPLEAKSPFELRVNLGKDVPETDVRSALATGHAGGWTPERVRALGVRALIAKPLTAAKLARTLRELLPETTPAAQP